MLIRRCAPWWTAAGWIVMLVWLTSEANLVALTDLSGAWIDRVQAADDNRARHGQQIERNPRRAGRLRL